MPLTNSTKQKIALPTATWSVSLFCDCPKRLENTDLLDFIDLRDGGQLSQVGVPLGLVQAINIEVICPDCDIHTQ